MDLLFDAVSKSFGERVVLDRVTIRVEDGEAVAILGPSGSGKTTILRLIAGLEEPTSGHVLFSGKELKKGEERDVTMWFADNRLIPIFTARANIEFPLTVRGTPAIERSERVEAEARTLGIESLLERMPSTLSAGQANLVHLAKAMVRAPGLFLVDEPLADLHSNLRNVLRTELRKIQVGYGATAVYATNDHQDAMVLADRIVIIDRGKVRQVGPPLDVYSAPVDLFVAKFLGSPTMSVLEAERTVGGVALGELRLTVSPGLETESCVVGVRPEHVVLSRHGLTTRIATVQDLGSDRYATAETSAGTLTLRCGDDHLMAGDVVTVDFSEFHVFDSESGLALHHGKSQRRP